MLQTLPNFQVRLLADEPRALPHIAAWLFHEWWCRNPENGLHTVVARLEECMNRDRLDLTLVCFSGDVPVGTVSLTRSDMSSRPDLTPWLAALYVAPEFRCRGAGSLLVNDALRHAARVGERKLYLFTMNAGPFYLDRGWKEAGRESVEDCEAVILERSTYSPATAPALS